MDLTVQQLRYFLAVAEELHFTRAAERLCLAAPSLSQQIALLERRLGVVLFRRTSRQVRLTAAGRELVPLARRAVSAVGDVAAWASERRTAGERIRVGLTVATPVGSAILAAAARLRGVRLEVRRVGFTDALDALRNDQVDVALVPDVRAPALSGIRVVPLWTEGRVLVVAEQHRLAGSRAVRLADTDEETFLGPHDDSATTARWFVDPRPGRKRVQIKPAGSNFEEIVELCLTGMGVNIAANSAVTTYARPGLRFVPIVDGPAAAMYLCQRSGAQTQALRTFERLAVKVAAETAREGGRRTAGDRQSLAPA